MLQTTFFQKRMKNSNRMIRKTEKVTKLNAVNNYGKKRLSNIFEKKILPKKMN